MQEAIVEYFYHGLYPGRFIEKVIRGDPSAMENAHALVKKWKDTESGEWKYFIALIECLPDEAKGDNFTEWLEHGGMEGCPSSKLVFLKLSRRDELILGDTVLTSRMPIRRIE